jgi:hypothetical protein
MNVTDVPVAVAPELYEEAAQTYAQLVQSRAIAVYRTGNVRYPGLSDLDLIVVTDRTGIDNRYFFSALQRMPRRFLPIFLHDPFILPAWSMRVMQHTTHRSPSLLAGRDVLSAYQPSTEEAERWCRMLESYCSYHLFAAKARERQTLSGRWTVAVASAYRFLLADAGEMAPRHAATEYAATIDDLRAHFFDRDPEQAVQEAWRIFSEHFDVFDATLREWLGVAEPQAALARARALLRGEESCDAFDREYAFIRARNIDGYHQELASMGFPYGYLFFTAAHPGAVRIADEPSPVTNLVRQYYRVRRRITEYAQGA